MRTNLVEMMVTHWESMYISTSMVTRLLAHGGERKTVVMVTIRVGGAGQDS